MCNENITLTWFVPSNEKKETTLTDYINKESNLDKISSYKVVEEFSKILEDADTFLAV